MKKLIASLLASALFLAAQAPPQGSYVYVVSKQTSLTAAAEVITIQEPASTARHIFMDGSYILCSVACTLTLERDGTGATTTALTVNKVRSQEPTATTTAFSASNVGVGTVLAQYDLAAGSPLVLDLSGMFMFGGGINSNVTFRTNSITGNVKFVIKFEESGVAQ